MAVFKSLLYLSFEAGLFALYIPLTLLRTGLKIDTGVISFLAIPFWLLGDWMVLRCFRDFTMRGRGTPLPADPPRELVVSGFYRYVQYPIYVGVLLIFIGHFLWFGYWALLIYTIVSYAVFHAYVVYYEAPNLKRKFRKPYEEYLERVSRWIPNFPKD